MKTKPMLFLLLLTVLTTCKQDQPYPFLNPDMSVRERVTDLVSRMTLEEKVSQMMSDAAAVDSLDIPKYNWWNECLHGVARAGIATVFPQAIGLAATWNSDLMHTLADVISTEARAKYNDFVSKGDRGIYKGLTFWSPNINIFRDPRWGRGQETYGEDPYLTSRMGVAFVTGLQGDDPHYLKVVSTPKHFAVHSGPEPDRHHFDVDVSDIDLWNTYLPAFEATLVEGKAFSVMGAYNRFRGQSCSAHTLLLGDILRDKWNFKGYVVSDCGAIRDIFAGHHLVNSATEAAALGVKNGCDLNCGRTYDNLVEAVNKGLIDESLIDTAVTRLFTARFRLGMFDPPERVPWSDIPISENDSPDHRKLALRVARESMVLLKNNDNLLPVDPSGIRKIAVIGPNADNTDVLVGNYNGTPAAPVTLLSGIRESVPEGTAVEYAQGCDLVENYSVLNTIPAAFLRTDHGAGLQGDYFTNMECKGEPAVVRTDSVISFEFGEGKMPEGIPPREFSVRWTGILVPPENGTYVLGVTGDDGYRLFVDGEKVIDLWSPHSATTIRKEMRLEKGHEYHLKLEYFQGGGDAMIQLAWALPGQNAYQDAVKLAASADLIIFAGGISPRLEGEEMNVPYEGFSGGDRTSLNLPAIQERLLKDLYATGKPVILVNFSGSAIALNWEDQYLPAIIQAWYPGQAGGTAIADVIFGKYNPAGRLPVTFYHSAEDLPPFTDYNMQGRTYRYFSGKVLYPFGYGLSFNHFTYGNIALSKAFLEGDEETEVSVEVTNDGQFTGDEVVQLYVEFPANEGPRPFKTLRDFKRIAFEPGEKKTITFTIDKKVLAFRNEEGTEVTPPGNYVLMVGKNAEEGIKIPLEVK